MEHSAVLTYIKTWATNYLAILYSPTTRPWAFCHNIDELIEKQSSIPAAKFTLVMDDMHTGAITGGTGNYQDRPKYGFMLMRKVRKTDYADEELAYSEAKVMAFKFIAQMRRDQEEQLNTIARFLEPGSIAYRRVGPQLENLHGCGITFDLRDNVNTIIQYNVNDYLPPPAP